MDPETLMSLLFVAIFVIVAYGLALWEAAYDRKQFERLSISSQQRQLSLVSTFYVRRAKQARRS
ncbi:MAG TPA: hypothetical protein VN397_01545 [Candidatus Methylomirabilis sp.]|nr:hypothetical protein [Candidatus Methylomirabilis sp.]